MPKFFKLGNKSKSPVSTNRNSKKSNKIATLNIFILASIAVSGFAHLIQINGMITKGYAIGELKETIANLEQEHSALELDALQLQSMARIKEEVQNLNMVAVGNLKHIAPTPVALAP